MDRDPGTHQPEPEPVDRKADMDALLKKTAGELSQPRPNGFGIKPLPRCPANVNPNERNLLMSTLNHFLPKIEAGLKIHMTTDFYIEMRGASVFLCNRLIPGEPYHVGDERQGEILPCYDPQGITDYMARLPESTMKGL